MALVYSETRFPPNWYIRNSGTLNQGNALFLGIVGPQLIQRVQRNDLNSGEFVEAVGRNTGVHLLLSGDGAFVAIAERIRHRLTIRAEANIVHCPTVNSDGCYSLGRESCAGAKTFFHALQR